MSAKTAAPKLEKPSWKQEAEETLKFHEAKQAEFGKPKRGRPDSISGKRGWNTYDTAKALGRDYYWTFYRILWGVKLRDNPNFVPETTKNESPKKARLETLLGILRTNILILKNDKRTVKIGTDLEKALRDYES